MWTLTSSVGGLKDVLVVPADLARQLKPSVQRGREYKDALRELLAINTRLVRLWREQEVKRRSGRRK
jgi:hypothetical protein